MHAVCQVDAVGNLVAVSAMNESITETSTIKLPFASSSKDLAAQDEDDEEDEDEQSDSEYSDEPDGDVAVAVSFKLARKPSKGKGGGGRSAASSRKTSIALDPGNYRISERNLYPTVLSTYRNFADF
ncbi:unnamed protein product, partial [Mesorhabditis spiculigera]